MATAPHDIPQQLPKTVRFQPSPYPTMPDMDSTTGHREVPPGATVFPPNRPGVPSGQAERVLPGQGHVGTETMTAGVAPWANTAAGTPAVVLPAASSSIAPGSSSNWTWWKTVLILSAVLLFVVILGISIKKIIGVYQNMSGKTLTLTDTGSTVTRPRVTRPRMDTERANREHRHRSRTEKPHEHRHRHHHRRRNGEERRER